MKGEWEAGKSEFIEAPVGTGVVHFLEVLPEGGEHQRKGQSPVVSLGAKFCFAAATLTRHFSPRDTPIITLAQMVWTLHNPVNLSKLTVTGRRSSP